MARPELKTNPRLVMTKMRGIDSPIIDEHAIALMLALAQGLDRFNVDNSRGAWSRDTAGAKLQLPQGKTLLVSGLGGIASEVARRAHELGMKVAATCVGGSGKPEFVEQTCWSARRTAGARADPRCDHLLSAADAGNHWHVRPALLCGAEAHRLLHQYCA